MPIRPRAALPLVLLLVATWASACSPWEEEEVAGLRHMTRTDSAPSGGSTRVGFPIDDGETNLLVTVQADPLRSVISALDGPGGEAWAADTSALRIPTNAGFVNTVSVLNWPILDSDAPLSGGRWSVSVGVVGDDLSYTGGDFRIDAWVATDATPEIGTVEVTFLLADGLDADPGLAAALDEAAAIWTDLYAAVGLTLQVSEQPLTGDTPGLPGVNDPDLWRALSADGITRVNIVIAELIEEVPDAYGLAGGIPGPLGSTGNSGVIVSATLASGQDGRFSTDETRILAETLAHETGHYLGLFHPVEIGWDRWDAVDDTPECDSDASCAKELSGNLMYPYPVCTRLLCEPQADLTEQQGRIARRWTGLR